MESVGVTPVTNGSAVGYAQGRKGRANAIQATGAKQPVWLASGPGGKPAWQFDGAKNLRMDALAAYLSGTANPGALTVGYRMGALAGGGNQTLVGFASNTSGNPWYYAYSSNSATSRVNVGRRNDSIGTSADRAGGWTTLQPSVLTVVFTGTTTRIRLNGWEWETFAHVAEPVTLKTVTIGALTRTSEGSFLNNNAEIAAVGIADVVPTETQLRRADRAMARRIGREWIGAYQRMVYEAGGHNAFTSAIRWNGYYWLAFRTGTDHLTTFDGQLKVLRATDWEGDWSVVKTVGSGLPNDWRDPQLCVTPGGRLMLSGRRRTTVNDGQTYAMFTTDGETWTAEAAIGPALYWLWHPVALGSAMWCVGYGGNVAGGDPAARLYQSVDDGVTWTAHTDLAANNSGATEADLWMRPSDSRMFIAIRGAGTTPTFYAQLGYADAPYTSFTWTNLTVGGASVTLHAPKFYDLGDETVLLGGRREAANRTVIHSLNLATGAMVEVLAPPSGTESSYLGGFMDGKKLRISDYSQHEQIGVTSKTRVYVYTAERV